MSETPYQTAYPLRLTGSLKEGLSRWLWLVKWLLLIPHYIVLTFLWLAFAVVTVVAFFAILVTGRYPHGLFAFNRGVLRWSWRVAYYGYGALGTDLYPPFTLAEVPDYPATLELDYPHQLSRGLVLTKWWLLALPHYLLLAAAAGAAAATADGRDGSVVSVGVLSLAVLFAGVSLLFRSTYPRGLFDLVLGLDRWGFRVLVYATLMTDVYPPFRLDQGGSDVGAAQPPAPASPTPATAIEPGSATPRGGSPTGRIVSLAVGVLAVVPALALTGVGGAGLWLNTQRDADGYVSTPTQAVSSSTAAVTVENVNLDLDRSTSTWLDARDLGRLRVEVSSDDGSPVFVGIAPQSDVDTWLAGRAHDEITRISGGAVRYTRRGGTPEVDAPAQQRFWTTSTTGTAGTVLPWQATSGRWALVTAHPDGSAGIQAHVSVAAKIPSLAAVASGLLGAGLVLLILAAALITWGASGLGRRHTPGHDGGTPAPQPRVDPVPVP